MKCHRVLRKKERVVKGERCVILIFTTEGKLSGKRGGKGYFSIFCLCAPVFDMTLLSI